MKSLLKLVVASSIVFSSGFLSVNAQVDAPLIDYKSEFHPVMARKGMVVAQERHAAEAGREMIRLGGNAIDAAVATGFALAVTYPQAGNIGGGGFMLAYVAAEDRTVAIDFREMAPAAAHRDMYLDNKGDVDTHKAMWSHRSSGVPGTVMGLTHALKKYGVLPLKTVMAPAIKLADEGFKMTWGVAASIASYKNRLSVDPDSLRYFYKADGSAYKAGELFRQPDLAKTLKAIANNGAAGFYEGWVADAIVTEMKTGAGIITLQDLKNYVVKEREAVKGTFRDSTVVSMPPPSSGGVHIVQMLNVLEGYELKRMGHNSAAYMHHMAESMKYAYADRSKYLGDPDFVNVPVKALTDKKYAAHIRSKIDSDKATPSKDILPADKLPYESDQTTHYSVMDAAGNAVSTTYTLNFSYGNGKAVGGAGFLLNNEMDDFSSKPGVPNGFGLLGGEANAIEAGKRPLSSMTPTIVFKDGKPFMITGSPGGSRIITATLQSILNAVEFKMNAAATVSVPRFHHQWMPDEILLESGISLDTVHILQSMGQNVNPYSKRAWRWVHPIHVVRAHSQRVIKII